MHSARPTSIPPDVRGRGWLLGLLLVVVAAAASAPKHSSNSRVTAAQLDLPPFADGDVDNDVAVVVDAAAEDVAVGFVVAADVVEAEPDLESSSVAQASEAGLAPNTSSYIYVIVNTPSLSSLYYYHLLPIFFNSKYS